MPIAIIELSWWKLWAITPVGCPGRRHRRWGGCYSILGHLQRGGTPSAAACLLATRLGTAWAALINEGIYGVMVAAWGDSTESVPLAQVVGKRKTVPVDHPWLDSARRVGTCLGGQVPICRH